MPGALAFLGLGAGLSQAASALGVLCGGLVYVIDIGRAPQGDHQAVSLSTARLCGTRNSGARVA